MHEFIDSFIQLIHVTFTEHMAKMVSMEKWVGDHDPNLANL